MRLLLDTNAFLWLVDEPENLSPKALGACGDQVNEILLSAVTVWELQIKQQLGKLRLARPLRDMVAQQVDLGNMKRLAIEDEHIYALGDLEMHHRDPFDRLLIAQARVERAKLVSNDSEIVKYEVEILW